MPEALRVGVPMKADASFTNPYASSDFPPRPKDTGHRIRRSLRLACSFSASVVVAGYAYCIVASGKAPDLSDWLQVLISWPTVWFGSLAEMTAAYTFLRPLTVGRQLRASIPLIFVAAFVSLFVLPELYSQVVAPMWIKLVDSSGVPWNAVFNWIPLVLSIPFSIAIALCAEYLSGRALGAIGVPMAGDDNRVA